MTFKTSDFVEKRKNTMNELKFFSYHSVDQSILSIVELTSDSFNPKWRQIQVELEQSQT